MKFLSKLNIFSRKKKIVAVIIETDKNELKAFDLQDNKADDLHSRLCLYHSCADRQLKDQVLIDMYYAGYSGIVKDLIDDHFLLRLCQDDNKIDLAIELSELKFGQIQFLSIA